MRKAVEVVDDNVELWLNLISYYLNYDSLEMGVEAFQSGVRALKNKSMPLWEILILYMGNTHPKLVKYIFQVLYFDDFSMINLIKVN